MKNPTSNLLSLLLLSVATGALVFGKTEVQAASSIEGPWTEGRHSGPGGSSDEERSRQTLQRTEEKSQGIKTKFQLQSNRDAEPLLKALENHLNQAREAMAGRNFPGVFASCAQAEVQIALLYNFGRRTFSEDRDESGPMSEKDNGNHNRDQLKAQAAWDLERALEHVELTVRHLQEDKSPNALALAEKCRALLDAAKLANSQGRFEQVRPLLEKIEFMRREVSQLKPRSGRFNDDGVRGSHSDGHNGLQPNNKSDLSDAMEIYNRVHERAVRASEPNAHSDEKSKAQFARIVDMLEKCREALNKGQTEAAKALGLKAETMLSEWHQGQGQKKPWDKNSTGKASFEKNGQDAVLSALGRLKIKLERAREIVATVNNDKASKILEKGLEHFERAEHSHSSGQAARAQVEMDIALKLAAKAVDIARSTSGR